MERGIKPLNKGTGKPGRMENMANMSYCRFRNTLLDLQDCEENWEDDDLSMEEEKAREQLLSLCQSIVDNYGDED